MSDSGEGGIETSNKDQKMEGDPAHVANGTKRNKAPVEALAGRWRRAERERVASRPEKHHILGGDGKSRHDSLPRRAEMVANLPRMGTPALASRARGKADTYAEHQAGDWGRVSWLRGRQRQLRREKVRVAENHGAPKASGRRNVEAATMRTA
ncbi:hypothetical protein K438DRAFT_1769493 [Mycena galopus ATCC 62051]|nr:hypothetical protein K438DRAFT_1769493 [Mycena galopus ATCC 62051]